MKLRYILPAAALVVGMSSAAQAACYHNGVGYGAGAKLCFGGWLQECTVAGYWKAIGQCRKDDEVGKILSVKLEQSPKVSKATPKTSN